MGDRDMSRSRTCARWGAALALITASAGCAGAGVYQSGVRAEQRGEPHIAYEHYLRAASLDPSAGRVHDALSRVGPRAAEHWADQGRDVEAAGQYGDAWRMYIRSLEIQPNNPTVTGLIREIDKRYPTAVADARRDWMRRGRAALAGRDERLASAADARSDDNGAPSTDPPSGMTDPDSPLAATDIHPGPAHGGGKKQPTVRSPREKRLARRETFNSFGGWAADAHASAIGGEDIENSGAVVRRNRNAGIQRNVDRGPAAQLDKALGFKLPPAPAAIENQPSGEQPFLVIHTLSRRDRRFVKTVESVDGIAIKLKDTDHERDADLSLYSGKKRIRKIKDIRVGETATFRGRSGRYFRLTVLFIHHKSRTVRVGIRPA